MNRTIVRTFALASLALACALSAPCQAQTQDSAAPYPKMAPLDQYMMQRDTEIALARSAAPDSISHDAEILVLAQHGYETAAQGTNGFVCLVTRSWNHPIDSPEFWNPKDRSPECYNPPAARTIVPLLLKRTELVLAGLSKEQVLYGVKAFAKTVPPLQPGAMCYMMSKQAYINDDAGHWVPHLMFYLTAGTAWGASLTGAPVIQGRTEVEGLPGPITEYLIPVLKWSDGTYQRTSAGAPAATNQ